MTNIYEALALSQLCRSDGYVKAQKKIALKYLDCLDDLGISLLKLTSGTESSWHLFVKKLRDKNKKEEVLNALKNKNNGVNVHYIILHL